MDVFCGWRSGRRVRYSGNQAPFVNSAYTRVGVILLAVGALAGTAAEEFGALNGRVFQDALGLVAAFILGQRTVGA